jgi:hypothetical protein
VRIVNHMAEALELEDQEAYERIFEPIWRSIRRHRDHRS